MKPYHILPAILVCGYFLNLPGYSTNGYWYSYFVYMFAHASIPHLVINTINLFIMIRFFSKSISPVLLYPFLYIAAVIAAFMSCVDTQTVGASGMIYASLGMYISMPLKGKRMVIINRKKYMYSILIIVGVFLMGLLFPNNINNINHLVALFCGILYGVLI